MGFRFSMWWELGGLQPESGGLQMEHIYGGHQLGAEWDPGFSV